MVLRHSTRWPDLMPEDALACVSTFIGLLPLKPIMDSSTAISADGFLAHLRKIIRFLYE